MFFIWFFYIFIHITQNIVFEGENVFQYFSHICRILHYMFGYYIYNLEFHGIDDYPLIRLIFIVSIFTNAIFYIKVYKTYTNLGFFDHLMTNLLHIFLTILAFVYQTISFDENIEDMVYKKQIIRYLLNTMLYYIIYNIILQYGFDIYCYKFINFVDNPITITFVFMILFFFVLIFI